MWHSYSGDTRDVLGPRPHWRSLMGLKNLEVLADEPIAKKPRDDSKTKKKEYFKTFDNLNVNIVVSQKPRYEHASKPRRKLASTSASSRSRVQKKKPAATVVRHKKPPPKLIQCQKDTSSSSSGDECDEIPDFEDIAQEPSCPPQTAPDRPNLALMAASTAINDDSDDNIPDFDAADLDLPSTSTKEYFIEKPVPTSLSSEKAEKVDSPESIVELRERIKVLEKELAGEKILNDKIQKEMNEQKLIANSQAIQIKEKETVNILLKDQAKSLHNYERKIAHLEDKVDELERSNAEMSSAYRDVRKIRNLLIAKIILASGSGDDDYVEEELKKLDMTNLMKKYEDSCSTNADSDCKAKKLQEKVDKLKRFRDKWKSKAKSAQEQIETMTTEKTAISELVGLKTQLLSALASDQEVTKKLEAHEKRLKEQWLCEQGTRDDAIRREFNEALESEKSKIEKLHKSELQNLINRQAALVSVLNLPEKSTWERIMDKIKWVMSENEANESIIVTHQLQMASSSIQ